MTSDELREKIEALGLITIRDAQRRWGLKNLRQNSPDRPPRVRLKGGRDWLTTLDAMRAIYGPEPLQEIMDEADVVTDGGRDDPAA